MENPFKPFQPLTEPDLPWYRGRDAEVDQLYELVTGTNVTLVFGEPGVGKTSLVHCGLARKFDASDWLGIWVRRGGHLVRSLKAELVNKLCDSTRKELEKTDGTLPVTDLLKKVYLDHFKTLYLIFDAFEELYASGSPEERAEFYGTLACLIEQKSNCRIIFIIREDYHGKLEELVKTLPQLFSKGLKVDPMPAADAEAEVIRSYLGHPAVVVHPSVEAVSGKIRAACTGEDGQTVSLAYLQVFLHTLWEKAEQQDGRALIHPAAVDNVAEYGNIIGYYLAEAVRSIDTEDRKDEIAIWAFLQDLVDQDGERKIMPLAHYTAAGFQRAPEWAEELVRQKILKYTGPGEVELTHDCLVPVIRARRTNTARPRLATPTLTGNPYKGLLSYEPEDCRRFFGRKEAVAALFRKVEGSSLVAVVGPSGSGKSSLVKAGLLPRLEAQGFHTICVKPEDVLLTARAEAGSASAFHFAGLEQQLYGQGHEKVALYIDQFEQLITRCQEDHLRRSFIDFITTTQNRSAGTLPAVIKVILTVRTDYEFQFDFFFPNWAQHKFNVPPLLESDYREIITEPAYHAGLSFSPAYLVDVILRDVKQSNGTLPLLSYTLFQMCEEYKEEQHAGFLTEDLYNQVGGVIGGLRAKAEQIYNSYPPDDPHRRTIRNVMLRMITGSGEIAGRKVYERDLVYTSMEENKRVQHVLNAFIDSRLVITDKDKYTNQVYYEPAHDSLVKNWIELSKWASDKEGKEYFYYAPSLKEAMKEEGQWKLWSEDPRLNVLASTLKSEHSWLNHTEAQFIQDSIREQRRKKRKKQGMALAVAFTILLLMIFNFQSRSAKQRAELDKEKSIEKAKGDLARLQKDSVDAKNKILDSLNKQLGKESAYNKKLYETAEEGRVKVKELNVLLENKRDSLEQTNKSLAKAFKDLDSTNKKLANNVYELKIANSKNQMLLREPFARSFDTATVNRFIDTLLTLQFDPHRKDEYDNTAAFQNVKSILNRIAKASDSARKNPNTGFILAKQTYDSVQEMKLTGFARRVVDSIGLGIANDNLFYTHKAELAYKLGSRIYLTAVSRDQSRFAFATVNGVHTGKIVKDTLQLDRQMPGREATTEGQPGLPGTYQNRVRYTALQYIDSNLLIGVTDGNEVHTWKPDHAYPAVRKGPDSFDPTVTRLAAVSPDGKIVLRTTNDSTVGILHNREPAEEEPWPQSFGAGAKVRNLIYHPAGHHALVLTDQDQCWILDIARKQSRRLDIQPVYAAGFAADGPYILYEGKEVFGLADLSGVRAGNTLSKNSLGLGGAPRSINLTLSRSWTSLVVQNELMENLFFEGWNPEGKRDSLFYFSFDEKDVTVRKAPVRAEGTFSFLPDTTLLAYTRPAYEQATFRFRLLLYKKHPPQPDFSGAHAAINPYLSRKDRKFLKLDPLSPQELYEEAMRLHKQSIEPDLTQAARKDLARRAKTILDTLNRREPLNEEYFYGWKQVKRNLYYTLDSNWGAYAQEVKRNIERTNGFLQHFAGDTAKIREYRRVLSSDYGSLSFYLVFSGRPPEVIAMAQEGLRIDPTNDFIYTNLALGYLLNKEFAKAKEEYRRLKGKYYRDSGRNFVPVFLKDFDLLEWWGVIDRNKDREIYDFAQRVRCWLQDEKKCSLD